MYRELLQNSNDADASTAEIFITTQPTASAPVVTQVVYRNDGLPFRHQDWSRLRKIAEGNPDVSKVGAFGVGAYTMFSICEEPMVISAGQALVFAWKGDSLWTKTANATYSTDKWTTFVLPSRDPYPVPDLVSFGQFLCGSLTFTHSLSTIHVYINDHRKLSISKTQVKPPTVITPPKATSWWNNDGAVTHSPNRFFSLRNENGAITETVIQMTVTFDDDQSKILARYVSAVADVRVPDSTARKITRVTKKNTPSNVNIQVFIDAVARSTARKGSRSQAIINAFSPEMGGGRVFIGFKTSQTTGIAAHLAAPLIPTVEREAIDLQNDALRMYNTELLSISGIVMRLTLEHAMGLIGERWGAAASISAEQAEHAVEKVNGEVSAHNGNIHFADNLDSQPSADGDQGEQRNTGFLGFARFMVGGVKKIADVISAIDPIGSDDDEVFNPTDPVPLSVVEQDAVMLMRAFCPRPSTPDHMVGSSIAAGFAACMPNSKPPVLTTSGVVRGSDARLPYKGIEAFVKSKVVRKVVLRNAEEYHKHVAVCPSLCFDDVSSEVQERCLTEDEAVRLIKWVVKYTRIDPNLGKEVALLKRHVRFHPRTVLQQTNSTIKEVYLKDYTYFVNNKRFSPELPMPPTVLPHSIMDALAQRYLEDYALRQWFAPLQFRAWVDFVVDHPSMTMGRARDASLRLKILSTISREYYTLDGTERAQFGKTLLSRLSNVKCIPYDDPRGFPSADIPGDLYLPSAELNTFEGLGSFRKVSSSLRNTGISDEFLLAIGVRKAISIDFLFTQLDALKWNENPKPLITYLRKATLSSQDLAKLKGTQYLPEMKDKSRTYAPSELHLPNLELHIFPFVKILQWSSQDGLNEWSADGKFLVKLGCRVNPPLDAVLKYMAYEKTEESIRLKCLNFVYKRLIAGGPYSKDYISQSNAYSGEPSHFLNMKFLPVVRTDPLDEKTFRELQAPSTCFINPSCGCMGFPILDVELEKGSEKMYGNTFRCSDSPSTDALLHRLLNLVSIAKSRLRSHEATTSCDFQQHILKVFAKIYRYLSTRASEFDKKQLEVLSKAPIIPVMSEDNLGWFRSHEVYFKNEADEGPEVTTALFHVVDFNPFLATIGVKREATIKDLFQMVLTNPKSVLTKLGGEEQYRGLLRRIASNPPYKTVTRQIRVSPFLLAYQLDMNSAAEDEGQDTSNPVKARYTMAKAEDICVIDNSFFARMFDVLSAPQESDLEDFYISLGAKYISQRVQTSFEVTGQTVDGTLLVKDFARRVNERRPLLVSPNITSRPLKKNAASLLDERHLSVYETATIEAHYRLGRKTRTQTVTCCAKQNGRGKNTLFITKNLDWFDVGNAIGGLILQRCQLEDSFFVGNLLEAPLSQLRSRGFPVDRILRADAPVRSEANVTRESNFPGHTGGVKSAHTPKVEQEFPEGRATQLVSEAKAAESGTPLGHSVNDTSQSKWKSRSQSKPAELISDKQGFQRILTEMFNNCAPEYINALLGPHPSLEKLKEVKDILERGDYPKVTTSGPTVSKPPTSEQPASKPPAPDKVAPGSIPNSKSATNPSTQSPPATQKSPRSTGSILDFITANARKSSSRPFATHSPPSSPPPPSSRAVESKESFSKRNNLFGRVFNIRGANRGLSHLTNEAVRSKEVTRDAPMTSEQDATAHHGTERLLANSVLKTRSVARSGFHSPERLMTSIPANLDRNGDGCEVIPPQNLVLFHGPGQMRLGIQVFSFRNNDNNLEADQFLRTNIDAIIAFRNVLHHLAEVYSVRADGMAIYYNPAGRTIAFNRQGGLYFNLRFFTSLHYVRGETPTADCYGFWYTTMAHELAHNLVSPHNKEHGYYTESFVSVYLPKLHQCLSGNAIRNRRGGFSR